MELCSNRAHLHKQKQFVSFQTMPANQWMQISQRSQTELLHCKIISLCNDPTYIHTYIHSLSISIHIPFIH